MDMKPAHLTVRTWHGLTPLALVAVLGLGGYAILRTGLMVGCHVSQTWATCEPERRSWQGEMGLVAAGFWLLYTKAPGTSEAPAPQQLTVAVPPWRRPEEPSTEAMLRDAFAQAIEDGVVSRVGPPKPSQEVVSPDAPPEEPAKPRARKLSTAQRMERAYSSRQRQGGS
jgi:hypothetical protein